MAQQETEFVPIPKPLYDRLDALGIIPSDVRSSNIGASDYSQHLIQPWSIWLDYNLNPFDADIVKRILRTKQTDPRILDYKKIIHICQERIRQLDREIPQQQPKKKQGFFSRLKRLLSF
jgi:hypothetical protein